MIYVLVLLLSLAAHPSGEDRCFLRLNNVPAVREAYVGVLLDYYDKATAKGLGNEVLHGRMSTARACHYYDVIERGENQFNPKAYV